MCEVGRGKAKKMQLRLIRSPACITGKPREAAAHTGARRALEPALRGPAGAVDGEVARGLQPRRGVGRQAPPSSAGTRTTQESVSKPDLGTRAAHGSVNPPRLHAPRDARTRLWFLFSSYLSAPERLRKPTRTPSPRPGPSPRSRAPARPTLPARTPRRCSARSVPACGAGGRCSSSLTCAGTLLWAASFRTPIPARAPNRAAKRSPHVWPRPAPPPAASPPGRQLPVWVRGKRVPLPVPPGPQRIWSVSAAEGEDGSTSGRPPQRRGRRAGCRSRSSCCGDDWGRGRWLQSPPSVSGCVGGGDVSGSCWKALGWRR